MKHKTPQADVFRLPSGLGIREMRVARGWTQEEMARLAGVSLSTVQRWEKSGARPSRLALREVERLERRVRAKPAIASKDGD